MAEAATQRSRAEVEAVAQGRGGGSGGAREGRGRRGGRWPEEEGEGWRVKIQWLLCVARISNCKSWREFFFSKDSHSIQACSRRPRKSS
jgi:hypothetical protein